MNKFNVQVAIEDKGICQRQSVHCEECPIGIFLGLADKDQMCNHEIVFTLAKLIRDCS